MKGGRLHHFSAEQGVLGACFRDPAAIASARALCVPEDFYTTAHGEVFRAICALADRSTIVEPIALAAELTQMGAFHSIGGYDYLAELYDAIPHAISVREHATLVQSSAARRTMMQVVTDARRLIMEPQGPSLDEIAGQVQSALSKAVSRAGRRGFQVVTMEEIIDLGDELAARKNAASAGGLVGIGSGYPEIDDMIGGFRAGELVIVGARPKCGKTALVLNIAVNAILDQDAHGGFVSTEMLRGELLERAGNRLAQLTTQQTGTGNLSDDELARFGKSLTPLRNRLHIDHEAFPTLENVIARSLDLKARHPEIQFLVVDYLQRVSKRMKGRRGDEEIAAVTQGIKELAKELGIPVFAPAQVNYKETDKRDNKAPTSADLQGGSGFAQDANFLFLLHRPGLFDIDPNLEYVLQVELAESRRTPKFTTRLDWQGRFMAVDSPLRRERVRHAA